MRLKLETIAQYTNYDVTPVSVALNSQHAFKAIRETKTVRTDRTYSKIETCKAIPMVWYNTVVGLTTAGPLHIQTPITMRVATNRSSS